MSFEQIKIKLQEGYWCFRKSKPHIHFLFEKNKIVGYDENKDFLSDYNGGEPLTFHDIKATDWDYLKS